MVRGLCRLRHCCVRLHRGLQLRGGATEGDEPRGALVPAHRLLLHVSLCLLLLFLLLFLYYYYFFLQ